MVYISAPLASVSIRVNYPLASNHRSFVWAISRCVGLESNLICRVDFANVSDAILDTTRRGGVSQPFRPILAILIGAVIMKVRLPASRHLLTMSGESLIAPHRRGDHGVAFERNFRLRVIDCLLSATPSPNRILRDTAKITPLGRSVDDCEILHSGY